MHSPRQSSISNNFEICYYASSLVPAETAAQTHESEILGVGPAMWVLTSPCGDSGVRPSLRTKQCSEVVRKS